MKKKSVFYISILILFLLRITIINSADIPSAYSDCEIYGVCVEEEIISFDNNTAFVNSTNIWVTNIGSLEDVNDTQHDNVAGALTIDQSWLIDYGSSFWLNLSGTNANQNINISPYNFEAGNITAYNITANNDLSVGNNIYIGDSDTDHFIYFYSGSPTGEYIRWETTFTWWEFTDSVRIYGTADVNELSSDGDIFTTGAGDDLWLGTDTQGSALFRAYATGDLIMQNLTANNGTFEELNVDTLNFNDNVITDSTGTINYKSHILMEDIGTGEGYKIYFNDVNNYIYKREAGNADLRIVTANQLNFEAPEVYTTGTLKVDNNDIWIDQDDKKLFVGEGQDASIYYDGGNLTINPREVGAGVLEYYGGIQCDTCIAIDSTGGGISLTALGYQTMANNSGAFATGYADGIFGIQASGSGSFAGGYVTDAIEGDPEILSLGLGSFAWGRAGTIETAGINITASGEGSVAMGYANEGGLVASGDGGISMGENVQGRANNVIIFGKDFVNDIADSFAVGFGDKTLTVADNNVTIYGNLDVSNNFTGNQIYGEMHFHNDTAGNVTALTEDVWTNVTAFEQDYSGQFLNGFSYQSNFLTAQVSGRYSVDYTITFTGTVNNRYHCAIGRNNTVQLNTETHDRISTGTDVLSASGTGFLDFNVGDNITLMMMNEDSGGDATINSVNVNLIRIGDIL